MTTQTTQKAPRTTIGVSNYTFWEMDDDSKAGNATTYKEPFSLTGTVEIVPTDAGATSTFDADNGPYEVDSYIEKMGHDITNADIPPEVDALWRGANLIDGGVEFEKDTAAKAPYFAVAWAILKGDGSYRLVRYYKGKFGFASNVGGKTKLSEGAPEHQTATANYSAVFRDSDNKGFYYLDTNTLPENVTQEQAMENWFTNPNWYPSIKE